MSLTRVWKATGPILLGFGLQLFFGLQLYAQQAGRLQPAGVAAGPVLDSAELYDDSHLKQGGYFWKMNHHEMGERILPGMPVKIRNVPELNYAHPPDVRQHNREMFGGVLGLSNAEINLLMEQKVIY